MLLNLITIQAQWIGLNCFITCHKPILYQPESKGPGGERLNNKSSQDPLSFSFSFFFRKLYHYIGKFLGLINFRRWYFASPNHILKVAMRGLATWRAEMKAIEIQRSISENAIFGNREKITLDADRQNEEKLRKNNKYDQLLSIL